VSFQYRKNTFKVIAEEFRALDITSDSEIFTLGLRQPVYRTPTTEVALELLGERLSLNTTLLGEPFDLTAGARKGESVVTAIRFVQEIVHRTQNQVIAVRSRMSFGTDWLGATARNGDQPDSHFFAWLGQFQAVRQFDSLAGTQASSGRICSSPTSVCWFSSRWPSADATRSEGIARTRSSGTTPS